MLSIKTKEEQLTDIFEEFILNNDTPSILQELPKLLKSYSKNAKRMDRILKQSDNQQLQVLKLTENLESRNKKVNNLLNNAGQGFLYFNKNMIVGDEYSKEVLRIFNEDVKTKNITTLLYQDEADQLFLQSTLTGILTDTPIRQEILISLLQKEFNINGYIIDIEYKVLDDNNFMMILTDITAKKELNKKIKDEQQILKMVVEIVTTLEQFIEIKTNYLNLILRINDYKSLSMMNELRREIHTFKGLFSQKEMLNIVQELHDFETDIDNSIKTDKLNSNVENITFAIMNSWLEKDIKILENILGDDFFSKSNHISIDRGRLGKLQAKIKLYIDEKRISGDGVDIIFKDIEELKYHSVKTLFRPYEKLTEQLSKRLNKEVNPLILNGDNIYIGNIYKSFISSLVHIFRNSLDHGIETAETRVELDKEEKGTITCNITQDNQDLTISIEDDGAGIDIEQIKKKAISKNILTNKQLDLMSEQDILSIIFQDDFSTSSTITDISGRGVGMASVLHELHKLGGDMEIVNNFGHGIKFTFMLPITHNENHEKDLLEKLSLRTISYYHENLNITLEKDFIIGEIDLIKTKDVAVLIPLTNEMDGVVYMGVSKEHAISLIDIFIDETMTSDEITELSIENIAETLNITLGNILKDLNIMKNGGIVGIKTPQILKENKAITKKENSKILVSKLKYKDEEIILGYFI